MICRSVGLLTRLSMCVSTTDFISLLKASVTQALSPFSETSAISDCDGKWHICWPVTEWLLEASVCFHITLVTKKLLHEKPQTATFTFTPFTVSLHKQNKIEILEAFHSTFNGTLWKKVANMWEGQYKVMVEVKSSSIIISWLLKFGNYVSYLI